MFNTNLQVEADSESPHWLLGSRKWYGGLSPRHFRSHSKERKLVAEASLGDQEAFALLYDRYVTRIYHYIRYKIGNTVEAEDLTEDVFVQAWFNIKDYQEPSSQFVAWLYRIAHNLITDYQRREHLRASLDEPKVRLHVSSKEKELLDEPIQEALTPRHLRQALSQLTKEQQEIVLLRFVSDLSISEISTILGKTERAVKALQLLALNELHRVLEDQTSTAPSPASSSLPITSSIQDEKDRSDLLIEVKRNRELVEAVMAEDWLGLKLLALLRSTNAVSLAELVAAAKTDAAKAGPILIHLVQSGAVSLEGEYFSCTPRGLDFLNNLEMSTKISLQP